MLAGLLASMSIFASLYNIEYLRRLYEDYHRNKDTVDETAKLFPAIQGPVLTRKWARITPIGLPVLFILTWLTILVRLILAATVSD